MSSERKIVLIGFMGVGKSATGAALARMLDLPFIELDAEIDRASGSSITEIFADEGESGFRRRETAALEEALGREGRAVISTGGGVVTVERNVELMRSSVAVAVWLRARLETVMDRVGEGGDRPNWRSGRADLGQMLEERIPLYSRSADLALETDDWAPEAVARAVIRGIADMERA